MAERLLPVCAPSLLEATGPFDGPGWFRRVTLIHDETFGAGPPLPDWQAWFVTAGFTEVPSAAGVGFSASSLCMAFAAAGGGLALGRSRIAAPWLADGRLVNPTGIEIPAPADYFLVVSPVLAETDPVRAFVDWIVEAAA
jgi:LysR family glycine cleavage system transcriptional activator